MPKDKLELLNGSHRQQFQESLNVLTDGECNIFFEEGDSSNLSPNTAKEQRKTLELDKAKEAIEQDSNVNYILDTLGGKIVDSSITPKEST